MNTPDLSSVAQKQNGVGGAGPAKSADLDTATTIGAGTIVYLSSTSNYDLGGQPAISIHYTFGAGTPVNCGSAGQVNLTSVGAHNGTLIDNWDSTQNAGATAAMGNPTAPATGTTWTINTIACGQTSALQVSSAVKSYTFNLTAATPAITTDQDPGATGCGTGCSAITPYESTFHAYLTSPTPGTSICYSTNGTPPSCTAGGGCGGGSTPTTSPSAAILINQSNTNLQAIGCHAGLTASNPTNQKFVLDVTTPVFIAGAGGTCSNNPQIGYNADTDKLAGGPSTGACICYTSDGSTPVCDPTNCTGGNQTPPVKTGTNCFVWTGTGSNTTMVGGPFAASVTVNTAACLTGFDPASGTQPLTTTPYTHGGPIDATDGTLAEWSAALESLPATNVHHNVIGHSVPYLTYDMTNLYLGLLYTTSTPDFTPSAGLYVAYLGDGNATGAATQFVPADGLFVIGPPGLPTAAGFKYAFTWATDGSSAPVTYKWNATTLQWVTTPFTVVAGFDVNDGSAEFQIALSALGLTPGVSTVTMAGNVITGAGTSSATYPELFPGPAFNGGAFAIADYWAANLASCLAPNTQVK
jgi:hypothetical protein